ncbi:aminoglycoside phosphotransferase family protein [Luedemannella helvata]|uniref:Aminoglycoside phosphotransferase family protein n=1 Tax=Luedemannella helvata TaxID=349315 RepID=A0ABP4W1C9_9ACTN
MHRLTVPAVLARNVAGAWGDAGRRWLADLPGVVAAVAADWRLTLADPYDLTYHWVAPATRADGAPVVLKLGVPGSPQLATEAAALTAYGGCGAVALLAHDPARGALLLERADPGTPLRALVPAADDEATAAVADVARRLHRPPPPGHGLPGLARLGRAFDGYLRSFPDDGPLPRGLVGKAAEVFAGLLATAPAGVLLHGDLHHDNVLRATRERWLAIDPHGLVGDPGYEAGALLYNPDPTRPDARLLPLVLPRVEALAHGLGLSADRVVAWGFVKAVLSEVWTVEDGGAPGGQAFAVARLLAGHLSV